jgi:carbamoyltransferase
MRIDRMIQRDRRPGGQAIEAASAVQRRIGELLLELVADIRRRSEHDTLCVGGGLFYNTYFTTLIRTSGIFDHVFVPINPGNAGLAVGAPLMVAGRDGNASASRELSPFLGPEYDADAIKAELDGCKLSYAFLNEGEVINTTVEALARGQLVGWFQGRMEWGHRSLGHRSILADPTSPYVLDNLNSFLRKRERWRSFGVSVRRDDVDDYFCGPPSSSWMQYEYSPRDPEELRHVMPPGASSIRVQTVTSDSRMFWQLHQGMKQARGKGVLVNTSFNSFREPIVCSPRDAVRVFYGTGLDLLVLGRFVLRK